MRLLGIESRHFELGRLERLRVKCAAGKTDQRRARKRLSIGREHDATHLGRPLESDILRERRLSRLWIDQHEGPVFTLTDNAAGLSAGSDLQVPWLVVPGCLALHE